MSARIDHRFDDRWEAIFMTGADLERYEPEIAREDFLRLNSDLTLSVLLPEGVLASYRMLIERQIFDDPLSVDRDSIVLIQEWSAYKPIESGELRFQVLLDKQTFPDNVEQNIQRSDLIFGYRATVLRKVDVDYSFTRSKGKLNLQPIPTFNYTQSFHQGLIDFRFSPVMRLELNLQLENRDYIVPDPINLSYNRNLWNPVVRVQQTPRFSYGIGYSEDVTRYRQVGELEDVLASDFDFTDQRVTLDTSYTNRKLSLIGNLGFGPRHYIHTQNEFQSNYDGLDVVLTGQYSFDSQTDFLISHSFSRQRYSLAPDNDNETTYLTANISHRF